MAEKDRMGRQLQGYSDDTNPDAISRNVRSMDSGAVTYSLNDRGITERTQESQSVYLQNPFTEGPAGVYTNMPSNYLNTNPFVEDAEQTFERQTGFELADGEQMLFDSSYNFLIDTNPEGIGFEEFAPSLEDAEEQTDRDLITSAFAGAMNEDYQDSIDLQLQELAELQAIEEAQSMEEYSQEDLEGLGFEFEDETLDEALQVYAEGDGVNLTATEEGLSEKSEFIFNDFTIGKDAIATEFVNDRELRPIFSRREEDFGAPIGTAVYDPKNQAITGYGIDSGVDFDTNIRTEIEQSRDLRFGGIPAETITSSPEQTASKLATAETTKRIADNATWRVASKALKSLDQVYNFSEADKAQINETAKGLNNDELKTYVRAIVSKNNNPDFTLHSMFNIPDMNKYEPPSNEQANIFNNKFNAAQLYFTQAYNKDKRQNEFINRSNLSEVLNNLYGVNRTFTDFDDQKMRHYAIAGGLISKLPNIGGAGSGNYTNISSARLEQISQVIENPRVGVSLYNPMFKGNIQDLVETDADGRVISGNVGFTASVVEDTIRSIIFSQQHEQNVRDSLISQSKDAQNAITTEFANVSSGMQNVMLAVSKGTPITGEEVDTINRFLSVTRTMAVATMDPATAVKMQSQAAITLSRTVEPVLTGLTNTLQSMGLNGINFSENDFPNTKEGEIQYERALTIRTRYLEIFGQFQAVANELGSMLLPEQQNRQTTAILNNVKAYLENNTPGEINTDDGTFSGKPVTYKIPNTEEIFGVRSTLTGVGQNTLYNNLMNPSSLVDKYVVLGNGAVVPKTALNQQGEGQGELNTGIGTNVTDPEGTPTVKPLEAKDLKGSSQKLLKQLTEQTEDQSQQVVIINQTIDNANTEKEELENSITDDTTISTQRNVEKRIKELDRIIDGLTRSVDKISDGLKTIGEVRAERTSGIMGRQFERFNPMGFGGYGMRGIPNRGL